MYLSRRRFLQASAVSGAGVLGATALVWAGGSGYSIQGLDASAYQGNPNWTSVRSSGKQFAFLKATEGTTYTNPGFASNWAKIKAAGLVRGAYHFGHPSLDPVAQADYFCNVVGPTAGDLQLTLDLEVTDGKTPAQVRTWLVSFLDRIQVLTGRPGIIYTGYYFWLNSAGNGSNLNCPLWLAAYVSNPAPYVPAAWNTWTFWQYTGTGAVSGVSGAVDQDAFNGTMTTLNALRLP